jgi:hypothetical protein
MSEPDIACSLCGLKLTNPRLANEMYLVAPGEKDIGPQLHQRMFAGECGTHGHRLAAFASEGHSTLLRSRFRKHFTKAEGRALRATLPDQERVNFQAAWSGQYMWDEEDVARWRGAIAP